MRSHWIPFAILLLGVACAAPEVAPEAAGDSLYELSGTVAQPLILNPAPPATSEVGLVWIRRVKLPSGELRLRLERGADAVLPADLPAPFALTLTDAPPPALQATYAFGDRLAGSTIGDAVATGLLVVARTGTLARLPAEFVEQYDAVGNPVGADFAAFLDDVLFVSPAFVVHVSGNASNGWDPRPSGFFIEDWERPIEQGLYSECVGRIQDRVMATPGFATCIADGTPARTSCVSDCAGRDALSRSYESDDACTDSCTQSRCLVEIAVPEFQPTCGNEPDWAYRDEIRPIPPTGLTLEPGRADVRNRVFAAGSITPVAYPFR